MTDIDNTQGLSPYNVSLVHAIPQLLSADQLASVPHVPSIRAHPKRSCCYIS